MRAEPRALRAWLKKALIASIDVDRRTQMIGERIRLVGTGLRPVYPGFRLNRRRAGKTGGALGQPAWRLRAGANDPTRAGRLGKGRRGGCRAGDRARVATGRGRPVSRD